MSNKMTYQTSNQTKHKGFNPNGTVAKGLIVEHQSGHIAASVDCKAFLPARAVLDSNPSYLIVKNPTDAERNEIFMLANKHDPERSQ
jgi:hypothetical protein